MGTIDVRGFVTDENALAIRFEASDLPGFLSKQLDVPKGAVAWVRDADGVESLLDAGTTQSGSFSAVLVKTHDQPISFQFDDLKTRTGRATRAGVEVVVRLPRREIGLRSLRSTLLQQSEQVGVEDLRSYLAASVRSGLLQFSRQRSAEELLLEDSREALADVVRRELARRTFEAGLETIEVRHPSFYCEEFEKFRQAQLEVSVQAEELKRSEQLQDLKARVERNEHLKKQEVEEFAKVLQYQGVLKELSLRQDVDRKRKDQEIRRYEAIHKRVGEDDLKAMIFLLEDDRLKAQLIEQLIERDMSEEQLRAKRETDVERRLEDKLAAFADQMAGLTGRRDKLVHESGTRTRRVFAVHGKQVVAFDPGANVRRQAPNEVYDFSNGPLGYARSVRTCTTRSGPMILVGAQKGVYLTPEGQNADRAQAFAYPKAPRGQGGVNAVAYFDGWIYATHSELGVYRWDVDGLVRPEPLFESTTCQHDSTRGVIVTAKGELLFACGPDLYRQDLVHRERPLTAFRGTGDGITAFCLSGSEVFAGTRSGRVLRWSQRDPGSPRELPIRKANPIYMLKIAELDGSPHLLVGAKEHGVTAVSIEDGRSVDYRAPDQVRWVDGATDFVFGVTRGGYAIHVWDAQRLDQVAVTIHTADRIQDLCVMKEPYEAA